MGGVTLKSRACLFALGAGLVAFVFTLATNAADGIRLATVAWALIPAVICMLMCWMGTERSLSTTASAIDAAIERLARAAKGDLSDRIPAEIAETVPELAEAMHRLFAQLNANLDGVRRLALYDVVTGLPNRTNFRRTCEHILATLEEPGGALFFIDLDRFKTVNDTMGHACGDMLLGMVANRLRAVADESSGAAGPVNAAPLIGRLAGDEFTIFFAEIDPVQARRIGRALLTALAAPFDLGGSDVTIGASIGIALRPDHGETLPDLMRAADAAMYAAKSSGRGRIELFSDALAAQITERANLEIALRDAVDRDEFTLVFQPQISTGTGRIVAAEALLRWRHPRDGLRLPHSFLERAEETGLIVEIGEWVVHTVAETIARWSRIGVEQRLSVNISPRQIDHASFFHRLRAAMHRADAPARLLELEITESLAMRCSDDVLEAIALLRADGATIAIDDFGTGYSNIARLRALPLDRIKLDHSLIARIADDAGARTIAQAVIGLIHGLGCQAVGEGVETQVQADILRIIGCDYIQGYAIAPPMDEPGFLAWSQGELRWAAVG